MTTSTAEAVKHTSGTDTTSVQNTMFIDWPVGDVGLPTCGLFDGADLSKCDLVFFDPWQFAVNNGLRSPEKEGSEADYKSYSESDFLSFLVKIKKASQSIQDLLKRNGTLVMRARLPKSFIKVRKKSSASATDYTESVVSAFFWLDDLIGSCNFKHCKSNIIKFAHPTGPFAEAFKATGTEIYQTLDSVGKGRTSVIAHGGPSGKAPVMSKVMFGPESGQVYFIPRFQVYDEPVKLIDVFKQASKVKDIDLDRPRWMEFYDRQITDYNPHRREIDRIELEIRALQKQKAVVERKAAQIGRLADLLFENGDNLRAAVETGLDILGFQSIETTGKRTAKMLRARGGSEIEEPVLVWTAAADQEPVAFKEYMKFSEALEEIRSTVVVKGIMVGNARCEYPPEKRDEWFDDETIQSAKQNNICLLPTLELYTVVCLVLSKLESKNIRDIKTALRKDLLGCNSQFAVKRIKYGL